MTVSRADLIARVLEEQAALNWLLGNCPDDRAVQDTYREYYDAALDALIDFDRNQAV